MTPDLLKLLSNVADNKLTINVKTGVENDTIVKLSVAAVVVGIALLVLKFMVFKK